MTLVKAYAVAAVVAAAAAMFSGPGTPPLVFWLYVAGAVLFALAALGQYFKESKRAR